ncbi:MAG TPA: hypothetical protein VMT47_01380, partial [Polyangia bacterium]|nr:hypothetical protein [Polyangia bacterium]
EPDELLARLAPVTLPGIEFLGAVRLGDGDRALGRVVTSAEFAARLPEGADLAGALARFEGEAPLSARRESDKGLARMIDVRRSLFAVTAFDDDALRARLDWPTGSLVRFGVKVSHEGSARPSEIARVLFNEETAARTDLARLAIWASQAGLPGEPEDAAVDPLRVAVLRRRPAVVAPAPAGGEPTAAVAP